MALKEFTLLDGQVVLLNTDQIASIHHKGEYICICMSNGEQWVTGTIALTQVKVEAGKSEGQ